MPSPGRRVIAVTLVAIMIALGLAWIVLLVHDIDRSAAAVHDDVLQALGVVAICSGIGVAAGRVLTGQAATRAEVALLREEIERWREAGADEYARGYVDGVARKQPEERRLVSLMPRP